ncbi:MAG: 6-carboxytetrahydropterin synthase [Holophagae bacterium]|jgi:6-pyruvoyltetrahydropterin/6-carboxytetrahydropterin synthase
MARWVIHSRASFDAAHALTRYRGRPEASHHHTWQVAIRVGAERLNPDGYALDFHEMHRVLADAVAPLDGSDLNRHPEIGRPTPSAERIAEVLSGKIGPVVEAAGGTLLEVSVWEGPDNRVDLVLVD